MILFVFSGIGFVSLLLSDIFQMICKTKYVIPTSLLGYISIFSTILIKSLQVSILPVILPILVLKILLVFLFLSALFYVLFIEIPFSSQYRHKDKRTVIDFGSYKIIRHPGFLCFLLLVGSLNLLYLQAEYLSLSLYLIFLNLLLILIEDILLFPKIFFNYKSYKTKVPFLIPGFKFRYKKELPGNDT